GFANLEPRRPERSAVHLGGVAAGRVSADSGCGGRFEGPAKDRHVELADRILAPEPDPIERTPTGGDDRHETVLPRGPRRGDRPRGPRQRQFLPRPYPVVAIEGVGKQLEDRIVGAPHQDVYVPGTLGADRALDGVPAGPHDASAQAGTDPPGERAKRGE